MEERSLSQRSNHNDRRVGIGLIGPIGRIRPI